MDVIDLLEHDHGTAKSLIKRFNDGEGDKEAIARELLDELEAHTSLEERLVYPALRGEVPDVDDVVVEGTEEHHVAEQLIDEIRGLDPSDEAWAAKVKVLGENVEHHIEEEQDELFPKVKDAMDSTRRQALGEEAQRLKRQLAFEAMTVVDLREKAKDAGFEGTSSMNKAELVDTLVDAALGASNAP